MQWHTRIPGRDPEDERQDCAIQCFFRSIWSRIFHTYMQNKKYRSRLKSYIRLSFASKYLKVNYTTLASTRRENLVIESSYGISRQSMTRIDSW